MNKRGRPPKPLYETTKPVAVKIKHIVDAKANGLTISGYIEFLKMQIKRREDAIQTLQAGLTAASKENKNHELGLQEQLMLEEVQEAERIINNNY